MDYYLNELEKLQEEFHDVMHDYPLFKEMIDDIDEKNIKEINALIEKNDEYYLKEANKKLKSLIEYIKKTSEEIQKEYDKFDKLAKEWEQKRILDNNDKLDIINAQIEKASELIQSHDLIKIKEANKILENVLKRI